MYLHLIVNLCVMMAPSDETSLACTCSLVRGAARRLTQYYDEALKETGLKVTQYGLLSTIERMDRPSVTDLADRLDLDRTTLTRNLAPLREAGWVRLAAGSDRRTRSVELTDRGREMLVLARPYWRRAEMALRQRAGGEVTTTLQNVLTQTVAAADAQQQ